MITRTLDEQDGIIFVAGYGRWSEHDVDEHYSALRQMIDKRRAAGLPVRVLSDVTQTTRQRPEIEARARLQMDRTYRPGDRVALLVADEETRRHVRIVLGGADVAAFCSRLPAEMWLMLDTPGMAA